MSMESDTSQGFVVTRTPLGGATILTPSGSITFENCTELRTALEETGEGPRPAVVIDCRQLSVMDSVALELLTEWHRKLQEKGGELKLTNLNDVCSDILMATRLLHVLNVCQDIKQAIQCG